MRIKLRKYEPAADSAISQVETEIGVTLPEDYRNFLSVYDGAIPEDNIFEDDLNIGVERFIPVSEVMKRAKRIDGFPEGGLPIAASAGGNYVYLTKSGFEVYFWDHEVEDDKKIAASFDEFLQKLKPFDASSIQLKPGQVKSVWIAPGFKPKFD
jgi:cell wall assembly regulator SMI1